MGRLIRHFLGWLRSRIIHILTRKLTTILIRSKGYHISPQFNSLCPNYKDEHELTIKLYPIKRNLGSLAGGSIQEVPMGYITFKRKLDIINIEVESETK